MFAARDGVIALALFLVVPSASADGGIRQAGCSGSATDAAHHGWRLAQAGEREPEPTDLPYTGPTRALRRRTLPG